MNDNSAGVSVTKGQEHCVGVVPEPGSRQKHAPAWKPICCRHQMFELVRRLVFQGDGQMVMSYVWNCGVCGRLVL